MSKTDQEDRSTGPAKKATSTETATTSDFLFPQLRLTEDDYGPAYGEPGPHGPSDRMLTELLRLARRYRVLLQSGDSDESLKMATKIGWILGEICQRADIDPSYGPEKKNPFNKVPPQKQLLFRLLVEALRHSWWGSDLFQSDTKQWRIRSADALLHMISAANSITDRPPNYLYVGELE